MVAWVRPPKKLRDWQKKTKMEICLYFLQVSHFTSQPVGERMIRREDPSDVGVAYVIVDGADDNAPHALAPPTYLVP